MTTMPVYCHNCGEVELEQAADVTTHICAENQACSYSFVCPKCQSVSGGPIQIETLQWAVSQGAAWRVWHLGRATDDAATIDANLPPLTDDDRIDFGLMLYSEDEFDKQLQALLG